MGSVPTEIRTGTGPVPTNDGGGEGEWREVLRGGRVCEGFERRGFGVHGVIRSFKAIRTPRETNHQKAMCSPFPCRHRRSLQGVKRITGAGGIGLAKDIADGNDEAVAGM